jgi:hypothetical protein
MAEANGGEGPVGEESYVAIYTAQLATWYNTENVEAYHSAGVFVFASDGANTLYAFNKAGEVVEFDQIGLEPHEALSLAHTFADFVTNLSTQTS